MASRRKSEYTVQMWEHKWYLDKFHTHECCFCGAQHNTEWKVESGRIYTRWRLDDKATKENRKRHGIRVIRKSE